MDSIAPLGLPPASIRLYPTPSSASSSAAAVAGQSVEPVDTVMISGVVEPTGSFDEILFDLQAKQSSDLPPSLASLLDEIKRFLDKAIQKAQEERSAFFDRLTQVQEKLQSTPGGEHVQAIGELVAAAAPDQANEFANALDRLVAMAGGKDSLPAGKVEVTDLRLGMKLTSQGTEVKLEGFQLSFRPLHQTGTPTPAATHLRLGNGKVSVSQE
jgi:hypothetical protein